MEKWTKILTVVLCLVLLCTLVAGCDPAGMKDPTTTPTQQGDGTTMPTQATMPTQTTVPSTAPTQPDDGSRTLLLTSQGGIAFVAQQITIYADAELTQQLTVLRTDEDGMASFQVEPESTCYARVGVPLGYVAETFTITEPMTHIQLRTKLPEIPSVGVDERELGEIMYDLRYTDREGNPWHLADAVASGKTSIVLYVQEQLAYRAEAGLKTLQTIYESYGDLVEVVLLCEKWPSEEQEWLEQLGLTYPVVMLDKWEKWDSFQSVYVVDRYGMIAMWDHVEALDAATAEGIVTYFTAEDYQQQLFDDGKELLNYLDSLNPAEEVTYQVTVLDDTGAPIAGTRLEMIYPRRSVFATTNEQGVATWTVKQREDYVVCVDNDLDELYFLEDDGLFVPGSTEKTIVLRRRQMTQYTVRAVDTDGNPVAGVKLWQRNGEQPMFTDASGIVQWQDLERETPYFYFSGEFAPTGYYYSHTEHNGTEDTFVFIKLYHYAVQIVDEAGNPMDWMQVRYQVEDNYGSIMTGEDGWVTFWQKKGDVTVVVDNTFRIGMGGHEIYTQTFVIPFGQEETVLTWVDQTEEYRVKLVQPDGTPIIRVTAVFLREDGSVVAQAMTQEDGTASFEVRPGVYKVWVYAEDWDGQIGEMVVIEYGIYDFPDGEREVTIVLENYEP